MAMNTVYILWWNYIGGGQFMLSALNAMPQSLNFIS